MRMRAEGGGGATSNIEPDYIMHAHVHIAMARRSRDEVDQLLFESVVSGYHVYKTVWTTFVEEILAVSPETADRHTVCLMPFTYYALNKEYALISQVRL